MKILIGADVVPSTTSEQLFIDGNLRELFGEVCDLIQNADRTVINLECALTNSDNKIKKFGPCIKASPQCATALKNLGVTDVMLSNNHVFDFGIQGLKDTMASLDEVGLPYTGVGENDTLARKPHVIEQGGKKIGFINVCEHEYSYALPDRMGCNAFDPFLTMHDIRALKKQVDFVVVLYHGGKEHCQYPSPRLRLLCREMVENGASVVITQHSHCIGCYEEYEGGHIVYGQGNFHFGWPNLSDKTWYESLLVELTIEDDLKIGFIPITATGTVIDLAKGERAEEIMQPFFARNAELKNGKWKEGWHAFCKSVFEKYNLATNRHERPDLFAHYLDCEAHTDVWRELFPTWNLTNEK